MQTRSTVREIADRAGVSRGTVDRVLNQRPHVRPDVRQRVILAMRELNYIPPKTQQAKALGLNIPVSENSKLGVLLPSWRGYFHREIMRGIMEAKDFLKAFSTEVLIEECETDMPEEVVERMDSLLDQGAVGLAICAKDNRIIGERIDALHKQNVPVVTYNSDVMNCNRLCYKRANLKK